MAEPVQPTRNRCGTMQVHRRLLDTQPGYAEARRRIEEHAFRHSRSMANGRPGCTKIPVVVHIVHKTAAQNISQAQIDSQIQVLNQDFRKQNPDVASVPGPFAPLVGDARLQFELASVDPEGNATDGITRRETDANGFDSDDAVKFAASGGTDAWPADRYLNIWVCQLQVGLLGYAQFPGGAANTDGVVITHTGFGTTGSASAPFNLGRTTTHEIGHWLNLRHIWGDDGDGCGGSDLVGDTPNQGGANVGKPGFPSISCSNDPNGDMFMNFMDYVDDDTMVMFSEGQVSRMQAALDGSRSVIGSSVTCAGGVPTKALPKDGPKDLQKEFSKEGPFDTQPKSFLEPPVGLPRPPVMQPMQPFQPFQPMQPANPFQPPGLGGMPTPFVLATGADSQSSYDSSREQAVAAYIQLLNHYSQLYQRGMLDSQGYAAWQEAWQAYQQMLA